MIFLSSSAARCLSRPKRQRRRAESVRLFVSRRQADLIFVAVEPPLWLAVTLMTTFVVARLAHTIVYATGQRHEVRATPYTIGSLVVMFMALYTLILAIFAQ